MYKLTIKDEMPKGIMFSFCDDEQEICGLLLDYIDAENLSAALIKMIKNKNLREALMYQKRIEDEKNNAKENGNGNSLPDLQSADRDDPSQSQQPKGD